MVYVQPGDVSSSRSVKVLELVRKKIKLGVNLNLIFVGNMILLHNSDIIELT